MNQKILIHHHAYVYKDTNGNYHMQSFIGRWLNELSNHSYAIGMLANITEKYDISFDTPINPGILFYQIKPSNRLRILKFFNIAQISRKISKDYDVLLVRGITPKQGIIWLFSRCKTKIFYFVGSIKESRPVLKKVGFFTFLSYYLRIFEIKYLFKDGNFISNSKLSCNELMELTTKTVNYIPSSSISEIEYIDSDKLTEKLQRPLSNLMFCGRVTFDKGIIELIKAFNNVLADHPYLKLYIIGRFIDPNFEIEVRTLISKLSLHNVYLIGFLPFGESLINHYQNADLFVYPTYHEGFPHSIWEAASQGTPVIASRVGGIPGILEHGEDVFLIDSKSIDEIEKAIKSLIANTKGRIKIARNIFEKCKFYSIEESTKFLCDYLQKLSI